ncbi:MULTISPECIES: DUF2325 domain-containing protein [Nitrosomonas]|uniref:Uncharacterized protein DUF2325 n=1 Tax=Nitrosomonas communis TaxID=44574 RepID=A0A0F7KFD5_9PROT|nr:MULTISPECIES: DUF2325 domain-containing protein [Nitrosomonas]AKH37868.1 hypothetical protein AAW31_08665 [Nitrosomonas communis]TYP92849.1 uncharacterized protein DUF2325 [Nitrosomonas communis]UVS63224.1 DUF2325 domain-containing protein [Nitrosomonas sp. PLL12]
MKSLKKTIFTLAFHGIDNFSGNALHDYSHHPSLITKYHTDNPEKKFTYIGKLFWLRDTLRAWLSAFRAISYAVIRPVSEQEPLPIIHSHFPGKGVYSNVNIRPETEWVPLIKAKPMIKSNASQEITEMHGSNLNLAGQTVLCVGGRATLYPDYLQLVEAAGGCFMIYRGNPESKRDHLYPLLDRVNMVICPVDCVSHDDYFAVKRYCKLSGKLCVFLERSSLPAFSQGLRMLVLQLRKDHYPA